jgi:hypothetical protein
VCQFENELQFVELLGVAVRKAKGPLYFISASLAA